MIAYIVAHPQTPTVALRELRKVAAAMGISPTIYVRLDTPTMQPGVVMLMQHAPQFLEMDELAWPKKGWG